MCNRPCRRSIWLSRETTVQVALVKGGNPSACFNRWGIGCWQDDYRSANIGVLNSTEEIHEHDLAFPLVTVIAGDQ
jgi:hypothetical protein